MLTLETPVQFVKGIGPTIAKMLAEKGVATVEDLLLHLPFRYEDRLNPRALNELKQGEMASVIGEVRGAVLLRTKRMPIFEMTVGQGLSSMKCLWFHGTYLEGKFKPGQMVALFGKVEASKSGRGFKMIQPQFEVLPDGHDDALDRILEVGRITPVYESLSGSKLASRWIRRTVWNVLEELKGHSGNLAAREAGIGSDAAGFAEPRAGAARGAFSSGWNGDGAVAGCGDAGASAADF